MGQHVFISYKRQDETFALNVMRQIQTAGFTAWIETDSARAGENWHEDVNAAIKDAVALVLVISPDAKSSEFVTYEWAFALGAGVPIVPVMPRSTVLHPQLQLLQPINFTDQYKPPWDNLFRRLFEIRGESQSHSVQVADDAPPAIKTAAAALNSQTPNERRAALMTLAQSNHPAAHDALVGAVQHPIRDVRVDAAFMLAKQTNNQDTAAIPGLIDALTDEDARIRGAAIKVLGAIGPASVAELLKASNKENDSNIRSTMTDAISAMGDVGLKGLLVALQHEEWKIRRGSIEVLWEMRDPAAIPGLIETLVDRHDVVRQASSSALEAMGVVAVRSLIPSLKSPSSQIRSAVAEVLTRIGTPDALAAVQQAQILGR